MEDGLLGARYLSLETFRRSGVGVRTPVWFAADQGLLFVYTDAASGKVRRLRRDGHVRIATCDARGKVKGAWVEGRAEIVADAEAERGMRLLRRKYWPWKQMLDLSLRLMPRHKRTVIAIRLQS